MLIEKGAVNKLGNINIDTGMIWFNSQIVDSLWNLISKKNKINSEKFNFFVNDRARLSFHTDFIFPLASSSTLEQYLNEKSENNEMICALNVYPYLIHIAIASALVKSAKNPELRVFSKVKFASSIHDFINTSSFVISSSSNYLSSKEINQQFHANCFCCCTMLCI